MIVKLQKFSAENLSTIGCKLLYNNKPFFLQTCKLKCKPCNCEVSKSKSSYRIKCEFPEKLHTVISELVSKFGTSVCFQNNYLLALREKGEKDVMVPCYRSGSNKEYTFKNFIKRTAETTFVCILDFAYNKKRNELLVMLKQIQYDRNPSEDYYFIDDEEDENVVEIISDPEDEDEDNWI